MDMRRGGMQALANKGLLDATFPVFIVRNPVDQYVAYLDEVERLQPAFERMLPEVLQYEGTDAAREMLHLMGDAAPHDSKQGPSHLSSPSCAGLGQADAGMCIALRILAAYLDMALAPAKKDADNAANAAALARDLRDRAKATGEDYQKLAMQAAVEVNPPPYRMSPLGHLTVTPR